MTAFPVAVAGAGIAGLAAAAVLARRGLPVTVYERSEDPREFGAGIYLKENSLPLLEETGAYAEVAAAGVALRAVRIADERNQVIVTRDTSRERVIVVQRAVLHGALRAAALRAGAKLVTGTTVTGARPDGTLLLGTRAGAGGEGEGEEVKAGLVVAADGVNSAVRDSLGLTRANRTLPTGATRLLIPRAGASQAGGRPAGGTADEDERFSTEYWAGRRRIGFAPCSADTTYVFAIGPQSDPRARRIPVDKEYWLSALPHLAPVIERIGDDGVHHAHAYVSCTAWTAGRVAIIGDAAHAQPPNLGQGAGLAIANARRLADFVAGGGDIPEMLRAWERHVRRPTRIVQSLTTAYDYAGTMSSLLPARSALFHRLSTFGPTARQWEYWWRGGLTAPGRPAWSAL